MATRPLSLSFLRPKRSCFFVRHDLFYGQKGRISSDMTRVLQTFFFCMHEVPLILLIVQYVCISVRRVDCNVHLLDTYIYTYTCIYTLLAGKAGVANGCRRHDLGERIQVFQSFLRAYPLCVCGEFERCKYRECGQLGARSDVAWGGQQNQPVHTKNKHKGTGRESY